MDKNLSQHNEASSFLVHDFNQSFYQMRHYDDQIMNIMKFLFTLYSGTIAIAVTLYQIGMKTRLALSIPGLAISLVGILVGILMLMVVVRNRVYFVQVTRYINEMRGLYLSFEPSGFSNLSGMYTNPYKPDYYDWKSSQLWCIRTIALFNAILAGVFAYIYTLNCAISIVSLMILLISELCIARWYLKSREGKSAEAAVFGVDTKSG